MGTENKSVEKIQNALHELFNEGRLNKPPFVYGKSTHNQRIEAWWGILRKHCAQFWINLFEILKNDDFFDGTFLDKSLIQYCFMEIVQVTNSLKKNKFIRIQKICSVHIASIFFQ